MKLKDKLTGDITEFEAVILVSTLSDENPNGDHPCLDYGNLEELLSKWEPINEKV